MVPEGAPKVPKRSPGRQKGSTRHVKWQTRVQRLGWQDTTPREWLRYNESVAPLPHWSQHNNQNVTAWSAAAYINELSAEIYLKVDENPRKEAKVSLLLLPWPPRVSQADKMVPWVPKWRHQAYEITVSGTKRDRSRFRNHGCLKRVT